MEAIDCDRNSSSSCCVLPREITARGNGPLRGARAVDVSRTAPASVGDVAVARRHSRSISGALWSRSFPPRVFEPLEIQVALAAIILTDFKSQQLEKCAP